MKIKKIPLQFWIFGKGTYFTKISVMSIENGVVYVYLRSASFVSEFAIMIIFARLLSVWTSIFSVVSLLLLEERNTIHHFSRSASTRYQ